MAQSDIPFPLSAANLAYAEDIYLDWLQDPQSVDSEWQSRFADMHKNGMSNGVAFRGNQPSYKPFSLYNPPTAAAARVGSSKDALEVKLEQLRNAYRAHGHRIAKINPLESRQTRTHDSNALPTELTPEYYGLTQEEARDTLAAMQRSYCGSVGIEYSHIDALEIREWLQDRIEGNHPTLSKEQRRHIFERLSDAVTFEDAIKNGFVGAKSFSILGGESLIPMLDWVIDKVGEHGVDEVIFGMAHRGRLNVLVNTLRKSAEQIFREFLDKNAEENIGRGDVKYHIGHSSDIQTLSGKDVHLTLCFNPSHLEFVGAVALGRTRAKEERKQGHSNGSKDLCVIIHGDAAFIGEGMGQETLNLSQLSAYEVGGSLHIIMNNQLGFTTDPQSGRSGHYASDIFKMLQAPIFHVNSDDPEAVVQVVNLAIDFRQRFKRDVLIDLYCYRRFGHNESDEPAFTQPLMYDEILSLSNIQQRYLDKLQAENIISNEEAQTVIAERKKHFDAALELAKSDELEAEKQTGAGLWQGYHGGAAGTLQEPDTRVAAEHITALLSKQVAFPEDFHPHRKVKRILSQRVEMGEGKRPFDWGSAEAAAFATILTENETGHRIRLTGQDVERGTFSHRHSVLHDVKDNHTFMPLAHLSDNQAPILIANSPLSESGVLGFEYGYSLDCPDGLVIWEAQYGDFANTGQVIFDQFISSGEDKWQRLSGLVMLLPHGFEGAGPEHSSARLERFLTMSAEDNWQIMNISTPANYFHALRRQALMKWRKPLVNMAPKSLLRHPRAVSNLDELANGSFQKVIPETVLEASAIRRVLLCTGKVYYDLLEKREAEGITDTAIIRLEQLYPVPVAELQAALSVYADDTPITWVQEEPWNMGAWFFMNSRLAPKLKQKLKCVARPESASPATGSNASHRIEQAQLMREAFGLE